MKKYGLIIVILIACFLRFFHLTTTPPGLNWDEVSIGYNAYSILKTGRDEWGKLLPMSFPAFGETKLPAMIYASIPALAIFGLTDFGVRITPALIGVLTVFVMYLLVKNMFGDKYALWAALLMAISPWHVHLSRASYEAGLALLFIMLSILFIEKAKKKSIFITCSVVFAALAMYSYNSARIVIPLLYPILVWRNWVQLKTKFKPLIIAFIVGAVMMIPALLSLKGGHALVRWDTVNIARSEGFKEGIGESRRYTPLPSPLPQLIHNTVTHYVYQVFLNYLKSFSSEFLFFAGDKYSQRSVQGMGLIYLFEFPAIIYGAFILGKNQNFNKIILPWLLIAPLPSAITVDAPSALRGLSVLPPLIILSSVGLSTFFRQVYKHKVALVLSLLFCTWNLGLFIYREFGAYPIQFASEWSYGYRDIVREMMKHYEGVDKIYMTTKQGEPYIYTLFYGGFEPRTFQTDPNLHKSTDGTGWTHVDSFGKFEFVDFNSEFYKPETILKRSKGKILFVGGFGDLGSLPRIYSVTAPNWQLMFEMAIGEGSSK